MGFNSSFKGLNESFPNRWLSRGGPNAWPPRSPDLTTPLDYYIWDHMKTLAYETKVDSRAALRDRIFAAAEHTTVLIKFIYSFYLVTEVPDHVYVLVISSSISDCCISIFHFSLCFGIPRPHMFIRSECQV